MFNKEKKEKTGKPVSLESRRGPLEWAKDKTYPLAVQLGANAPLLYGISEGADYLEKFGSLALASYYTAAAVTAGALNWGLEKYILKPIEKIEKKQRELGDVTFGRRIVPVIITAAMLYGLMGPQAVRTIAEDHVKMYDNFSKAKSALVQKVGEGCDQISSGFSNIGEGVSDFGGGIGSAWAQINAPIGKVCAYVPDDSYSNSVEGILKKNQ